MSSASFKHDFSPNHKTTINILAAEGSLLQITLLLVIFTWSSFRIGILCLLAIAVVSFLGAVFYFYRQFQSLGIVKEKISISARLNEDTNNISDNKSEISRREKRGEEIKKNRDHEIEIREREHSAFHANLVSERISIDSRERLEIERLFVSLQQHHFTDGMLQATQRPRRKMAG